MDNDTVIIQLLSEIRDELRASRSAKNHKKLSDEDAVAVREIFPVISRAISVRPFTVKMLYAHAQLEVRPAIELREALAKTNPRKLGRLLARACEFPIDGYLVRNAGTHRDGKLWVLRCDDSNSHKLATLAIPRTVTLNR